ncbi:hypothetical protein HaLaN_15219, partial [Haematococcus lacustris]
MSMPRQMTDATASSRHSCWRNVINHSWSSLRQGRSCCLLDKRRPDASCYCAASGQECGPLPGGCEGSASVVASSPVKRVRGWRVAWGPACVWKGAPLPGAKCMAACILNTCRLIVQARDSEQCMG